MDNDLKKENAEIALENLSATEFELLGMLILKEGEVIPQISARLKADDFYLPLHQKIYQSIVDVYATGKVPSTITIVNDFQAKGILLNHTDYSRILDLGRVAFTTAYADDYAQKIKALSIRRKAIQYVNGLLRNLNDPAVDNADIFDDAENLFRSLNTATQPTTALITPHDYFSQFLDSDIEQNVIYANRKTGFSNIDEHQTFSAGLYVLGATPAAGKTTFAWQLLEQLAKNGEQCIFCSYEMSLLELYSKTLARELFLRDNQTTLTAADIRKKATCHTLETIKQEFKSNQNLKGVNLLPMRDETVDDLLRLIKPYCKDKAPVICVDYLQVIPPSNDKKLISDKMKIDDIVRKLKVFQRETNTTFIVVSSFNRMNYYAQVSFESFKDSGNIEYTADVIWAMQLDIANHIKGENISEIRKQFEDAKKQQPREIQLKCLKNRSGNNYDCYFNYFSAHEFYQPCAQFDSVDTQDNWGGFTADDFTGKELSPAENKKINDMLGFNDNDFKK